MKINLIKTIGSCYQIYPLCLCNISSSSCVPKFSTAKCPSLVSIPQSTVLKDISNQASQLQENLCEAKSNSLFTAELIRAIKNLMCTVILVGFELEIRVTVDLEIFCSALLLLTAPSTEYNFFYSSSKDLFFIFEKHYVFTGLTYMSLRYIQIRYLPTPIFSHRCLCISNDLEAQINMTKLHCLT